MNEPQKRRSTVELPRSKTSAGRIRTDNLRVMIQLRVGLEKLGGKICAAVSTRLPPQLVGKPEASEAEKGSDARRAQNIRRETAIGRQAEEEPREGATREGAPRPSLEGKRRSELCRALARHNSRPQWETERFPLKEILTRPSGRTVSDLYRRLRRAVPYPLGYKGIGAPGWIRTNNVCVACMALAIGRVKKTFRVRVLKPRDFLSVSKTDAFTTWPRPQDGRRESNPHWLRVGLGRLDAKKSVLRGGHCSWPGRGLERFGEGARQPAAVPRCEIWPPE